MSRGKINTIATNGKYTPYNLNVTLASLGATTVGQNLVTLPNPSAITFIRINADNSVSALSASDFRTAIGAGTSTVTPSALSKTDDTNVTLTLGGSPNTSLLAATSITVGWTGTLDDSRISSATIWNAKQAALSGTGFVKISGTTISYDNSTYYLASNPSNFIALSSTLAGLSITGSSIVTSDTLIGAFGALQNQINGLLGGSIYQGTWNASTNTPALISSVGTKGNYYVVNVAGATNLNGITDWAVGDWAIFNGTVWQKVDNTDAVSSVNSAIGAVVITVTGTTDRLTVVGGTGLTPTIDISASYVGQTSITTLGTVATGVWNGAAIGDTYISSAATWNAKLGVSAIGVSVQAYSANTTILGNTTTGSGSTLVLATSPTLVTPVLGVASATSINKVTITTPATGSTLTIADGKTLTVNSTLTFSGTDSSTLNIGTGGTLGTAAYTASSAYEVPLTFSTGLTRTTNTITNNLSVGVSGGQTIIGGTAVGDILTYKGTTGNGTSTVAAHTFVVGNNGATTAAVMLNSGSTIFGGVTTLVGTEVLSVQTNQNAATRLTISNSTAGTASQAAIYLQTSGSIGLDFNLYSASFTTSGSAIAGTARIQSSTANGISIGTSNTAPIMFRIGAPEVWRIDANGGFNNTGATGSTKALLEIASTTKGVLIPRMTTTQRNAITSPPEGLQLFDTTLKKNFVYTTAWEEEMTVTAVTTETVIADRTLTIKFNGSTYKIDAKFIS